MCGVVGFIGNFAENKDKIMALIDESAVRGTHAFGYSTYNKSTRKIESFRSLYIKEVKAALERQAPDHFIYHNRFSTSGGWQDMVNNQPIALFDRAIALNGVISQGTHPENQKTYGLKLSTDNDAEIMLLQPDKAKFLKDSRGSLAGLVLESGYIYYFRNARRPLWTRKDPSGAQFFASTKDIFKRSGFPTCILVREGYRRVSIEKLY